VLKAVLDIEFSNTLRPNKKLIPIINGINKLIEDWGTFIIAEESKNQKGEVNE